MFDIDTLKPYEYYKYSSGTVLIKTKHTALIVNCLCAERSATERQPRIQEQFLEYTPFYVVQLKNAPVAYNGNTLVNAIGSNSDTLDNTMIF